MVIRPVSEGEAEAVEEIGAFRRTLANALTEQGDTAWAGIVLIDRSETLGVYARLAGYSSGLSSRHGQAAFESALKRWKVGPNALPDADVTTTFAQSGEKLQLRFHWDVVLQLCSCLYEPDLDTVPMENRPSLLDRLHINKKDRRDPRPIRPPRVSFVGQLVDPALQDAACFNMTFLSAFDDGQFDRLRSGWELKETFDRRSELVRRQEMYKSLERRYSDAQLIEERSLLLAKWPLDPKLRVRSWPVWWQT